MLYILISITVADLGGAETPSVLADPQKTEKKRKTLGCVTVTALHVTSPATFPSATVHWGRCTGSALLAVDQFGRTRAGALDELEVFCRHSQLYSCTCYVSQNPKG